MQKVLKLHISLDRTCFLSGGVILTVGAMFLRDLSGVSISRFFFLILATAIFLFSELEDIYLYMIFIAPIHTGLPYSFIMAIAWLVLFIRKRRFSLPSIVYLGIGLILLIEICNGFRGEFTISGLLQFAGAFLFFFFVLCDRDTIIDCERSSRFYVFGTIIAIIDLWIQMLQNYSMNQILKLHVRFGNTREILNVESEGMLLSYNTNMLGGICVLCSLICLLFVLKRNKSRPWYMAIFIISSVTGFLTLSRTAIIAYLIGVTLFAIIAGENYRRRIFIAVVVGILFCIIYFVIINYFQNFYNYMELRFRAIDITNGRNLLFSEYMNSAMSSIDRMLFGVGLQGYQIKSDVSNSCHNAIQEVFVAWGLIGLVITIICFVFMFKIQKKLNPSAMLVNYLPAFIFLLILQSGQGFSVRGNILSLIAAVGAIGINIEKQGEFG